MTRVQSIDSNPAKQLVTAESQPPTLNSKKQLNPYNSSVGKSSKEAITLGLKRFIWEKLAHISEMIPNIGLPGTLFLPTSQTFFISFTSE